MNVFVGALRRRLGVEFFVTVHQGIRIIESMGWRQDLVWVVRFASGCMERV